MPVTFVIGRSGSGKTRHCFESIRNALVADPLGPPLYWILPRQATFDAERTLTCETGLGGFCRARVVSFERLGREIFADCGGSAIPEVSGVGRQMILGHLLRRLKPELRFYSGVARQIGLAAQLDVAFAELERNGKDADDLRALISDLEAEQGGIGFEMTPLRDKLHDLHLIYAAYAAFLGQGRLDQHQRDRQVQELLGQCKLVRQAHFYVDGFLDFTAHERKLLAGIAGVAAGVTVTLTMDPASSLLRDPNLLPLEMSPFFRTEQTYRKLYFGFLEKNVSFNQPIKLTKTPRFAAAPLGHIEKHFFDVGPSAFSDPDRSRAVERFEAPDHRAEVDAVARRIRALVAHRESGMRLRDIIVLARNLDTYHALIEASFAEHGIAWFADRRRSGSHHPLLRVVRSLFQIIRYNWRQDAVMTLVRSGLVGISDYDADALENYLESHQLRGAGAWESAEPWEFQKRINASEDEIGDAGRAVDLPVTAVDASGLNGATKPIQATIDIDAMRRKLVEQIKAISALALAAEPLTVRKIATAIYEALDSLGAPEALSRWAAEARDAGKLEEAGEHEQVWAGLSELFQQMVDLLGEETVELADFVDVLESGLEQFDLALTPPMVDQVLVGQVDRTRSPRVRAAFVLGLNDGSFPATLTESSILTDRERRTLRDKSLELDPDLRTRTMDERLLGYIALTRASERLILTRSTSDVAGKAVAPSIFWRQIGDLVPVSSQFTIAGGRRFDVDHIATPRQLTTALMQWVREGAAADGPFDVATPGASDQSAEAGQPSPWPALYQWFASQPFDDGQIDIARRLAWRALSYHNDAVLDSAISAQLFRRDLIVSAGQLETFAACSFKHFARYGLSLEAPARGDLRPSDLGQLYHRVLDRVMQAALRDQVDASPDALSQAMIRACTAEVSETLRRALRLGASRTRYLLARTEAILGRFIESQRALAERGQFRPAFTAVKFGADQRVGPVAIHTPGGARVAIHGAIDRVDLLSSDVADPEAPTPISVVDYRQGPRTLSLDEVFYGLSLQLVIALQALQNDGAALAGRPLAPAAAFFQPMLRKFTDKSHPQSGADASDEDFLLQNKPRGIFNAAELANFDRELMHTGGWSKVVQAYWTKSGTLGNKSRSDALEPEEFAALLAHVAKQIGTLVDTMLSGQVKVAPYMLGNRTPCPHCDFRDVCRFQTTTNRYRHLSKLGREGVIDQVLSRTSEAADGE